MLKIEPKPMQGYYVVTLNGKVVHKGSKRSCKHFVSVTWQGLPDVTVNSYMEQAA